MTRIKKSTGSHLKRRKKVKRKLGIIPDNCFNEGLNALLQIRTCQHHSIARIPKWTALGQDVPYRFGAQKKNHGWTSSLKKSDFYRLLLVALILSVWNLKLLTPQNLRCAAAGIKLPQLATDPEALKGPRIGPGGFGSGGYCAGTSSGLFIGDTPFTAMIYNGWCWSFFFEEFIQIHFNPPIPFRWQVPPKCPLSPGQALTGSQPAVFPQAMAAKPSIHACSFGNPPDPDKITTYPGVARRSLAHGDPKGMVHGALWDMLKWWWVKGGKVE